MSQFRNGHIVTFYSYKGGTGRTMALANTAWILASNGHRVLVVDWDLESPGLHKFFRPFLDGDMISGTTGVIDLIKEFAWAATRPEPRPADWHTRYADVGRHVLSVEWPHFPDGGSLDFLPAGRQNRDYSSLVSTFDWDNFYERLGGGQFLDALRVDMRRGYDYVLIDSRTGLSDIADICTVHFPDTVVTCFTLSDQSIEGAARVASEIAERFPDRRIRILPVPMRVDDAEKEKLDAGRAFARSQFEGFPSDLGQDQAGSYWGAVEIPYKPFYAYEETLATFGDAPGSPGSLLAAYERLTGVITGGRVSSLPPLDEELRLSHRELFVRRRPSLSNDVSLSYVPEDRLWAEWIAAVLTQAGMRVRTQGGEREEDESGQARTPEAAGRTVALLSPAYLRSRQARETWHAAEGPATLSAHLLPVRVSDVRVPQTYADPPALDLFRLDEQHAAAALLRALDRPAGTEAVGQGGTPRYPGIQPAILNLPTRNAAFTGRGEVLERLRDQLVGGSQAVVTQVQEGRTQALFGLGGVGKTHLAIEYAHRFMSDYDVVWWVSAEQPELLNGAMADLAERLGIRIGDNLAEAALAAKDALRRGEPYARWLLIFDNANSADDVQTYLPGGSGHVLITSRSQTWSQIAKPLEIDVFTREESLEHLRRRVADLSDEEADRVAAALGDLPLAIEQAGAWLQETGMSVDEYVDKLAKQPVRTLALGDSPTTYPTPVAATWNVSFQRLREKSPAAVRLLQLLAFFAAEPVSLSMLYGDETVRCLVRYDDSLREKIMIGRLVRELNRFALAKVDQRNNSVQVHRLVQAVLRDQMDDDERERTVHEVHRILLGARPREGDTDDPGNWPRYDEIWPHLAPSNAEECDEEETRQLLIDRVRYLYRRGEFDRALSLGRRLEELWIRKLGDYDRQTLYLRFHMGNVLRSQGRYLEACDLNRAILEDQRRVLPDPHPHTLQTAGSLAADLRALGELSESLRMEQETYARTKELFFDDHPRVLAAANNLAVALRHVGDIGAARRLDQETADKRREVLGPAHPFTLLSETNLALDIREAGEYAKSADLLRETLNSYGEVSGPELPDTLNTARSLAVSLRETGALAEARRLTETTYERCLQRFGPESPDTVACKLSLACDLAASGDRRRAYELASEVRASYESKLGADNPYTLIAANNITIYLRHLGELAESRALGTRTLATLRRKVGPDHPFSLACGVNVANTLGDLQDYPEAEKLQRDTLDRLRAVLGPHHPTTLICEADLAVTLRDVRRTDEARVLREPLLVQLRRILGEAHPVIAAVLDWRRVDRELEPLPW
ncbi:FxSxx-COOH system tetratricopeptide repeat protein [Microbispora hainanensis]|uniref:FxSxx-COOH system tetratricopeptide repeat protein n=1 Tax=Microbispora TaxID=2005 RepID=UPI00115A501A|nr:MULTISPECIES: FxSxx-COOH system tetratricopeptide repeat protein [Microbispora]NJP23285.1 tetratricopeptide repeat protein [Microbispora sp. CL1-1]TQS16362.1 tetratricopeptide repeat protein [Microbispora sp. SCL1-1]